MINTFHSSFNPPPVPPRQGHRGPVLVTNTPLVKFLSVMLLLLMLLTFGGFLYLFHRLGMQMPYEYSDADTLKQLQQCKDKSLRLQETEYCKKLLENYKAGLTQEGKVAFLIGKGFSTISLAQLVLQGNPPTLKSGDQPNSLPWDEDHSLVKNIHLNKNGIVTIENPGYYFVHSQVSFSKGHTKVPLRQVVWSRKPKKDEKEKVDWEKLLISYCSLTENRSPPAVCTASQAGVFRLEEGQELFVNVTGRDLVNAESSTFGLFKLQD